jgi:Tol biopolymer transport system component
MVLLGRRLAAAGSAIAIAVVAVGGGLGRGAVISEAERPVSPCGTATAPTWSPDGKQIAWYGYRWPLPPHPHAVGSYNILRAICVSDADGKHLHRLSHTVCSEHCPNAFRDPPGRLDWVRPTLLLSGNDLGIFTVSVGKNPGLLGKTGPVPFSVDASGDRVASGANDCSVCAGPVTVLSVPSGAVVGEIGGTKLDNSEPSLSPDGTKVVFTRSPAEDSGAGPAIWTAAADGSHLQLLERHGDNPIWSPAGNRIAYLAPTGAARYALRLVAPQGGASTTLLRNGPGTVFGWSRNGHWIAFPDSDGKLAVVDVATKKVSRLLKLRLPYDSSSVAWSPDSRRLLVVWRSAAHSSCPSGLWQVPTDGPKPRLVHTC